MKVYADTSVFGGVFDEEFTEPSKEFFAEVESGRFDLVVSAVVQAEIDSAPKEVKEIQRSQCAQGLSCYWCIFTLTGNRLW